MNTFKVLRRKPTLFFRLSGIRMDDFDRLIKQTYPLWLKSEHKRLSRTNRKRSIGAGRKYELNFSTRLLMCLIYYRTYTSHVFLGLVFSVPSPTVRRASKPGKRKKNYSGKKKRHTVVHQIITDNTKRILAVCPTQYGSKHDRQKRCGLG